MVRFDGQVALVTGSGVGLGRAYALLLASRGAKVVVNDPGRTPDGRGSNPAAADAVVAEIRAAGGEAVANYDSIAEASGAENAIRAATAAYGRLDILVNNAGILRDAPLATSTLDDLQQVIAVNFLGSLYCTRAALRIMEPRGYGKIVNIGSIAGISGLSFHSPHYSASKGGMVAFTRSVGLEVIGAGINVNCVAAGGVGTEAWDLMIARAGDALRLQLMQLIPAGRLGTIDEYASLVLYLASDAAAYIVGQVISPNGGMVT